MKKLSIYLLLIAGLVCYGCQNENESETVPASIELSADHLSFVNNYSGEQAVTVTSSVPWTASSSKNWCKLSSTYGDPGATRLKVSLDANTSIASREAIITITAKDLDPLSIKVTQLGEQEEIVLFQPVVNIEGEAQQLAVSLTSNVEKLTIDIPQSASWVKILTSVQQATSGSGIEKTFLFSIYGNATSTDRTATITFKGGKATPATLTINQKPQKLTVLNIINANIDETIGMRAAGMQVMFDVQATVNYELTIEGDWLQENSKTGNSYVLDMLTNTGAAREGRVIVSQVGSELSDTLIIKQLGVGEEFIGSHYMDSIALCGMYKALDMANWAPVNGVSWAFDLERPLNEWKQIKLDENGRVKGWQVVGMQKSDTNFRFTIPSDIKNLTQMRKIALNTWNLGGIPEELGQLSHLDTLALIGNMTGTIPASLGNLSNLRYLSISGNVQKDPSSSSSIIRVCGLTGGIPVTIYNLTKLELLRINCTKLGGTISYNISRLTKLKELYLEENRLSGTIPVGLALLSDLEAISFEVNQLNGSIPAELGDLSKLEVLALDMNNLTGEIPENLCNLSNLAYLYLYTNGLSGTIPANIGNMGNLVAVILAENELTGSIPESVDNLTKLEAFIVPYNKLSGSVPAGLLSKVKADSRNFMICPQIGTNFTNHTCQ